VTAGPVVCWGYNSDGQLGTGNTTDQWKPVAVSGITGVTSLSVMARPVRS